ncbi:MAG: Ppx/GppA family phosphatase [Planctomycetes bacterium]|nr:Ppx/GppA family phosphatase [Planctomycetota bacterium]
MIVADVTGPHSFYVIDRERERVKLGAGAFKTGRLNPENMEAALAALQRFSQLCKRLGVKRILAVATSAVREAANGRQFLAAVKRRTGIDARVITGKDEAQLIYRGIRHAIDLEGRRALMLDLGGGSLEVMYGNAARLVRAHSLPLGVQRLRDHFGGNDPLPRKHRNALLKHIRRQLAPVLRPIKNKGIDTVICTSGTQMTLGLACLRMRGRDPWGALNGYVIRASELRDLHNQLIDDDVMGRARLPGIDERRADTIHFGSAVLTTALDIVGVRSVQLCGASLREGVLLQQMERLARKVGVNPVRVQSALELLTRAGGDAARGAHLAALACALFDGTSRRHGLGRRDRELLETAALLEDLGRGLHLQDREHLSYQLIRGGGLRGLTDLELEVVGLIARYSRGGAPKSRHRQFAEIDPDSQHVVRVLAGILRVADGLDRGRAGAVRDVRCRTVRGCLYISPVSRVDVSLERHAAQRSTKLLAQALDLDVIINGVKAR